MIDKCSTGVTNQVSEIGCSFVDQIAFCESAATNHGRFVRCVAQLAIVWGRTGKIQNRDRGKIIRCAARANIPPREKR